MARKKKKSFLKRINKNVNSFIDYTAKAIFGAPAKDPAHQALINTNTAQFTISGNSFEEWVREAYYNNEVVNRSLNLIINTLCEANLRVVDEEGKVLDMHPTNLLFQHINDSETQKQFLKRLVLYLMLGDIGFVQKVFTRGGKVTELGLLRPDKVKIYAKEEIGIEEYEYMPNGTNKPAYRLNNNEVIPVMFIDPLSRLAGYSPLKSLARRIDTDNEHTKHTMAVLQNGGVPGAILKVTDPLDRDQATDLALSFNQRVAGSNKGSTIVLHGGVEYEQLGGSFKDLEAKELAKVNEAKILSTLGIPLPVFGSISGTDATTYDNMRTAMKIFWRQTIIPLQSMLEDYFNGDPDLINKADYIKGIRLKFDRSTVEALKEDQDLLSERARLDYSAGLITLNEARQAGGYEPLVDGDALKQIGFQMPDLPQDENNQEQEKFIDILNEINTKLTPAPQEEEHAEEFTASDYQEEIKDELDEQLEEVVKTIEQEQLERRIKDFEIATKRMQIADRFSFEYFKLARKHLTKHIGDVAKLVGGKDIGEEKLETKFEEVPLQNQVDDLVAAWAVSLQADSVDLVEELVKESAEQAAAQLGVAFDLQSQNVQEAIAAEQYKFANKVSETSAKEIKKVISRSFEEGLSVKDLRKEIMKLGDQFNQVRAEAIARTETVRAANQGARLGYKQGGATKLRYSAVLDGSTSDICQELDGKIVGIDEQFLTQEEGFVDSNGRSVDLSYSDGVPEPPAHPNCRSTIIPEFDDNQF